jgi:hypothetical protein
MAREHRPALDKITSSADLRRWYWLKSELTDEARRRGLKVSGAKFDLLDRLAHHMDTGEADRPRAKARRVTSDFDWHAAPLNIATVLTDSYRNTQNVRRFFKAQIGSGFSFNIAFMDWMKSNQGKTLGDAIHAYHAQKAAALSTPSKIKPHNQFNQYTRDFLAHNPGAGMAEVRRVWKLKRSLPSADGRHRYDPADLDL